MVRGNLDVAVLQPDFRISSREILHGMFGGVIPRDAFYRFMDEVVIDRNLPGSTPQEPEKEVRSLIVRDFENTTESQIKYAWFKAIDPGEFKMLHPAYWKDDNGLPSGPGRSRPLDVCDELDSVRRQAMLSNF